MAPKRVALSQSERLRSENFVEIEPAKAGADSFVAGYLGDVLTKQLIPGVPVERERGTLYFSRAQLESRYITATTLIFRVLKHPATDPFSSRRCIDIHPPQLHRVGRGALQTECADEPIATDRHPKAAVVLAIIGGNPINLLGQRTFNVSFKGIAQVRRAEKPIGSDK